MFETQLCFCKFATFHNMVWFLGFGYYSLTSLSAELENASFKFGVGFATILDDVRDATYQTSHKCNVRMH